MVTWRLTFIFFGVNCCYLASSSSTHCRHGARLKRCGQRSRFWVWCR